MLLSSLNNIRRMLKNEIRRVQSRIAEEIKKDLKAACPVDNGDLRESIHIEKEGKNSLIIGSRLPQMYFTNYGNGGGKPIKAKHGKYMWFKSNKTYNLPMSGDYYYAEEVKPYKGTGWMGYVAAKYMTKYGG